ncbi:hypothetical protein GGX14DRAFT_564915 [Mycena pura]|uniref:NADP-dependent oxidoreductase domain-containing protein n=1 Tax=Mycena pura TaxID=153505 RepID=A0AAD6VFS3_9AGAR|nr:hypothetical protein GGX14DRAFT_564915 [Mycena pura]
MSHTTEATGVQQLECHGLLQYLDRMFSAVHHLEELTAANLELPAVNQIELHPLCQQKPIVEYCRANSIVVQAYCPIIRGNMDHEVITKIASKTLPTTCAPHRSKYDLKISPCTSELGVSLAWLSALLYAIPTNPSPDGITLFDAANSYSATRHRRALAHRP